MSTSRQTQSIPGILVRHFGLGVVLIVAAAAVLLMTDTRRNSDQRSADAVRKVAIVNYVSVPTLEEGEAGVNEGLNEGGFVDGKNMTIKRYNAEGDRSTAIMIANEVLGGNFDVVISISTPMLQSVANANLDTRRTHVFTVSSDPWGAGVGIDRANPAIHPAYMTGQGSLPPVAKLFELAREANPQLKRVGTVWNPSESNSEAATMMAREICKKLNIELVEITVDSSSGVLDAAKALVARQVEAFWAGGDATVAAAHNTLIGTARDGGIPVFANMLSYVKDGALFSLGADYHEVGRSGGLLAARVLKGADPAKIPIDNYAPDVLALNLVALDKFRAKWKFGPDWAERAALIVDRTGPHQKRPKPSPAPAKR
jgi:putative tryptophan/tyrosine transport system substrate-binding protein